MFLSSTQRFEGRVGAAAKFAEKLFFVLNLFEMVEPSVLAYRDFAVPVHKLIVSEVVKDVKHVVVEVSHVLPVGFQLDFRDLAPALPGVLVLHPLVMGTGPPAPFFGERGRKVPVPNVPVAPPGSPADTWRFRDPLVLWVGLVSAWSRE